jgi:hypothetical protein
MATTVQSVNIDIDIEKLKHTLESTTKDGAPGEYYVVIQITPGFDPGATNPTEVVLDGTLTVDQQNQVIGIVDAHLSNREPTKTILTSDLKVEQDLSVDGQQTIVHSETVEIDDHLIQLNSNVIAPEEVYSGVEVNRGGSPTAAPLSAIIAYDERAGQNVGWKCGLGESGLARIVTETTLANYSITRGQIEAGTARNVLFNGDNGHISETSDPSKPFKFLYDGVNYFGSLVIPQDVSGSGIAAFCAEQIISPMPLLTAPAPLLWLDADGSTSLNTTPAHGIYFRVDKTLKWMITENIISSWQSGNNETAARKIRTVYDGGFGSGYYLIDQNGVERQTLSLAAGTGPTGGDTYLKSDSNLFLAADNTNSNRTLWHISANSITNFDITKQGSIGTSAKPISSVYSNAVSFRGYNGVYDGTWTIYHDSNGDTLFFDCNASAEMALNTTELYPWVNNGLQLGTSSRRFLNGYFTDLNVTNTITGNITGNAGTVTNGVYTSGDQTIYGYKDFRQEIRAFAPSSGISQIRLYDTNVGNTRDAALLFRCDADNFYMLLTDDGGGPAGGWSLSKAWPLYLSLADGHCTIAAKALNSSLHDMVFTVTGGLAYKFYANSKLFMEITDGYGIDIYPDVDDAAAISINNKAFFTGTPYWWDIWTNNSGELVFCKDTGNNRLKMDVRPGGTTSGPQPHLCKSNSGAGAWFQFTTTEGDDNTKRPDNPAYGCIYYNKKGSPGTPTSHDVEIFTANGWQVLHSVT